MTSRTLVILTLVITSVCYWFQVHPQHKVSLKKSRTYTHSRVLGDARRIAELNEFGMFGLNDLPFHSHDWNTAFEFSQFAPDQDLIAGKDRDGTICVFDLVTARLWATSQFRCHAFRFCRGGKIAAQDKSGTDPFEWKIWDIATGDISSLRLIPDQDYGTTSTQVVDFRSCILDDTLFVSAGDWLAEIDTDTGLLTTIVRWTPLIDVLAMADGDYTKKWLQEAFCRGLPKVRFATTDNIILDFGPKVQFHLIRQANRWNCTVLQGPYVIGCDPERGTWVLDDGSGVPQLVDAEQLSQVQSNDGDRAFGWQYSPAPYSIVRYDASLDREIIVDIPHSNSQSPDVGYEMGNRLLRVSNLKTGDLYELVHECKNQLINNGDASSLNLSRDGKYVVFTMCQDSHKFTRTIVWKLPDYQK